MGSFVSTNSMRFSLRLCVLLTTVLSLVTSLANAQDSSQPDSKLLDQALQQAEKLPRLQSLLVARNGVPLIEKVFDGPGLDQPVNIKSLSKTVLTALVGVAIERGVFEGVDQPIVTLLGERVPERTTPGVEEITVSHLLSLQAGLRRTSHQYYGAWVTSDNWVHHILTRPFDAEPGGPFIYSTGSSHLLSAALTEASGHSTLQLARDWLGEPLNIAIPPWDTDPQGIYFGGNNMRLSPRALLKIGELYRQGGTYEGKRILPESWIETSWTGRGKSEYTDDPYGYGWFIFQLAGEQAYYGRGFGGQMLYVIPGLGITAVMTSDPSPPSPGSSYLQKQNRLLEDFIIPALQETAGQ